MSGFTDFRQNGELSDITVVIGDQSYRLHRFPLFCRSGYFMECAKSSNNSTVDLSDIPGGSEIFTLIADFCYNIDIDINKKNVIELVAASSYLKMTGDRNLTFRAQSYLIDCIASAKLARNDTLIADFLQRSVTNCPDDIQATIMEQCLEALVDCWTKPTSLFTSLSRHQNNYISVATLSTLPTDLFANILSRARERGVRNVLLANLTYQYLSTVMDNFSGSSTPTEKADDGCEKESTKSGDNEPSKQEDEAKEKTDYTEYAKLLDVLLLELPNDGSMAKCANPQWVVKSLKIATARDCKCKAFLIKTAGEMFRALSPDDLCTMTPSVVHDLISQSIELKPDNQTYASSCALVDLYLQLLQDKGEINSENFKLLATSVPSVHREFDDQLYFGLESVFKLEKDSLSPETLKELTDLVNLERVQDSVLQQALDEGIFPPKSIADAALKRCIELRAKLYYYQGDVRSQLTRYSKWNGRYSSQNSDSLIAGESGLADGDGVRATPTYTYRPIAEDHDVRNRDEMDYYYSQAFQSAGNLRTPRSRYTSSRYYKSY